MLRFWVFLMYPLSLLALLIVIYLLNSYEGPTFAHFYNKFYDISDLTGPKPKINRHQSFLYSLWFTSALDTSILCSKNTVVSVVSFSLNNLKYTALKPNHSVLKLTITPMHY